MGIMNSDLVKFGVDILTKFLEIVNKATNGIEGLGGSFVKVIGVVAMFKMGKQIFEKFAPSLSKMFTGIAEMAYEGGYNAGRRFAEGVEAAKQEQEAKDKGEQPEEKPKEDKQEEEKPTEKKSFKEKLAEKTGISDIKEGWGKKKKV
jgi:hypothetical protein